MFMPLQIHKPCLEHLHVESICVHAVFDFEVALIERPNDDVVAEMYRKKLGWSNLPSRTYSSSLDSMEDVETTRIR